MRDSRLALLVLLLATLAVVSCATWIQRGLAPAGEESVSVPLPAARPTPETIPPEKPAELAARRLRWPVDGMQSRALRDSFNDRRGGRVHQALDIMAPRGTPVRAVEGGTIAKVYRHALGGLSVYQYDVERRYAYYYAHLDAFAPGVQAGHVVVPGALLGYVGTTGNAAPGSPHLHFAIYRLGPERQWWRGTPVNPFPLFEGRAGDG